MPNFILHFKRSCEVFADDSRMTYVHLAVYMSVFYHWNSKKFIDSMPINRERIMHTACLVSKKVYYRVLHELHECGYITYVASHHPRRPSEVTVHDPENPVCRTPIDTTLDTTTDPTEDPERPPSINNPNGINGVNKTREDAPTHVSEKNEGKGSTRHSRPVNLQEAVDYFRAQKQTDLEAEKFYNYYQASGWVRRDRTPIRDWLAAAKSWILKIGVFEGKKPDTPKGPKPNHLATDSNKDFAEPY
jgi:hypothetical protein